MNADDPDDLEEFAALMAEWDDALAAGKTGETLSVDGLPAALEPELLRTLACCRQVRQVLGPGPVAESCSAAKTPWKSLGRFRIVREIGRGGCGIVFLAHDPRLVREVALKVPRAEIEVTPELRERFHREARVTAGLDHPNVVAVFEAGEVGEVCFLVSAYCPGLTLAQWLKQRIEPVPFPSIAALLVLLADAVQHAHSRGVLHRDLKPGNVILQMEATPSEGADNDLHSAIPKITDFGLAKVLQEGAGGGLTQTGTVLGTLKYMAPEQAAGKSKEVGPAADLYALGAILYELLTGRPPFLGDTALDLSLQVQMEDPVPPSRLRPRTPRDLETICLKCLQKEPGKRYGSAQDLADDLRHYQAGESILARPVSPWERSWRWAKRRPTLAALVCVSVLAVLMLSIGGLWYQGRLLAALQLAQDRQGETQRHLYHSLVREAQAIRRARESGYRTKAWDRLQQALELKTPEVDVEELRREAVASMGDFVGLEPSTWPEFPASILAVASPPQGELVAVSLKDGSVVVCARDGDHRQRLQIGAAEVEAVTFSPDGRVLACGNRDGVIKVFERQAKGVWECTQTLSTHPEVVSLIITADGKQLLAGCWDAVEVPVWELRNGTALAKFDGHGKQLGNLALSPDGRFLASRSYRDGTHGLLVWEVATKKLLHTLPSPSEINNLAFSPNSRLLACACEEGVTVFETATFTEHLFVRGDTVKSIAFTPDSQLLAFGCPQIGTIRLWSPASNREVVALKHPESMRGLETLMFRADGNELLAADARALRLWNLAGAGEKLALSGHAGGTVDVAFSHDSRLLVSASKDRTVKLWDPGTGKLLRTLSGFNGPVAGISLGPDARLLAAIDWAGKIRIWEVYSGQELMPPALRDPGLGKVLWSIAFSPRGDYLAACGHGLTIWRYDYQPGAEEKLRLEKIARPTERYPISLTFNAQGTLLAWVESDHTVHLWDMVAMQARPAPAVRTLGTVHSLAFLPDGEHLLFVGQSGEAEAWNVITGQKAFSFGDGQFTGRNALGVIALSRDGAYLASQSAQSLAVSIWDMHTRRPLLILPAERNTIWPLAWSPDRKLLAVGLSDGGLVIWNLPRIHGELAAMHLGW